MHNQIGITINLTMHSCETNNPCIHTCHTLIYGRGPRSEVGVGKSNESWVTCHVLNDHLTKLNDINQVILKLSRKRRTSDGWGNKPHSPPPPPAIAVSLKIKFINCQVLLKVWWYSIKSYLSYHVIVQNWMSSSQRKIPPPLFVIICRYHGNALSATVVNFCQHADSYILRLAGV